MKSRRLNWKDKMSVSLKLIGYELKILPRKAVWGVLITLLLVSLALIFGSRNSFPFVAWILFENLAPFVLLFNGVALLDNDRTHKTLDILFSRPGSRFGIFLRRLILVYSLNVLILGALSFLWQIKNEAPSMPEILLTSVSPALFLTSLGFCSAVVLNDANGGASVGGAWWFINQFILARYGDQGWFGYVFLFKRTYYPHSTQFVGNRIALFFLGVSFIVVTAIAFRKGERFIR